MIKRVGTAVPLTALWSEHVDEGRSTLAVGELFVTWLSRIGQGAWQLLPLHETQLTPSGHFRAPSPYKSYGVGLNPTFFSSSWERHPTGQELAVFREQHAFWLSDYALFCAATEFFGTDSWNRWDEGLATRQDLSFWRKKLKANIYVHEVCQWQLLSQYRRLRRYARKRGVLLLGDMPFYVGFSSPLVWAHQELFDLVDGRPLYVSGCPDGPKAHFGRQVWGHPLYKWHEHSLLPEILSLWKARIAFLVELFDWVRLDHIKGFFQYGAMDVHTAKKDRMLSGPGAGVLIRLIHFARDKKLAVFAEDSGDRLLSLRRTLRRQRVPGMRIFRYGLTVKGGEELHSEYAEVGHYPANSVAYTSTHDTETLVGYLSGLTVPQLQRVAAAAKVAFTTDVLTLAAELRRAVVRSPSRLVVVPLQDWLLTTERVNVPGTERAEHDPNWRYRVPMAIEHLPEEIVVL